MTRRQERALETRAAIVAAARQLWGERGYFATSTSDIVAAAQVGTRGAFYAHFADREQLFLAVFDDVRHDLASLDVRPLTGVDPLTALQSVLSAFLDVVVDAPDVRALLVDGPAVFGPTRWHQAERAGGLVPIEHRIQEAIEAGVVETQPIRPLAQLLLMLVNDTALLIASSADRSSARRDVGAAMSRLVGGLRSG